MLWHKTEGDELTGCLKLDFGTKNGLDMATAVNNKVLAHLAQSEDPQQQVDTSKILLHFGLLFAYNVVEYHDDGNKLCKCGARDETCGHNELCAVRKQWAEWLLKLFGPFTVLNQAVEKRQMLNVMLRTLLQYRKTNKLPALIEQNMSKLALTKRIL